MDAAFIQDRIVTKKIQIIAYEDAVTALASDAIQSYTLDTGQSRQVVTKLNLTELRNMVDSLYNDLLTLENRILHGGAVVVRPTW